jgi:hypothetical protein
LLCGDRLEIFLSGSFRVNISRFLNRIIFLVTDLRRFARLTANETKAPVEPDLREVNGVEADLRLANYSAA